MGGGNTEAEKNEQNLVDHNKGNIDLGLDKIREIVGGDAAPNTEDAAAKQGS